MQQSTPTPQPAFEPVERAKAEVESSVSAPGLRDHATGLSAPPDQRTMAAKRTAEPADSSKAAVIRPLLCLRIVADETAVVAERLRPMVERLGGSLLESGAGHAVIKLDAVRLPAFMEQPARLGRITERPTGALPREGWVELQLSW